MSSNYGFQPTLSGLNTIESDNTTSSDIICNTISIANSGTAPTMTSGDNSNHIATTAYVDGAISGSGFVTLTGTQTVSGQKTFTAGNTIVTGNLVCKTFLSDNSGSNFNIGTNLFTGNIFLGTGTGATGNINIGGATTKTTLNGTNTINSITGKYIDLFAGQLRMFSGTGGGSSIYFYVPPSGRSIMDFSTTNADMVGQYNLTSNNMTCAVAPTTANEYCNKTYVDSVANYTNLLSSNNTWTAPNTFDDIVTNNFQVTNNDVVSFQNGAFFDNVCPYSTVPASAGHDLVTKDFTETSTQTISGAKTFTNFTATKAAAGATIDFGVSTTGAINLYVNGFATRLLKLGFLAGAYPMLYNENADPLYLVAGNSLPSGGVGSLQIRGDYWSTGVGGVVLTSRTHALSGLDVQGNLQGYLGTELTISSPIKPTYSYASLASTSIGYQFVGTTSSTKITTTTQTLATIAIPSAGVWNVEYQINPVGLGGSVYIILSISATNNVHDNGRLTTKAVNNGNYTHNSNNMIVLTGATTLYFIANQGSGGTATSTTSFMRATRIA